MSNLVEEFDESFTWRLVRDLLGEEEQESFSEICRKYKFHRDFDPITELLVIPVPPDSDIKWEMLLTKAFSKVQSTLKKIVDPDERGKIEEAINTLIGIMKWSLLQSYQSAIPDTEAFFLKAIEKARAIHNTTTFSIPSPQPVAENNGHDSASIKVVPCQIENRKLLDAMESFEDLWEYLLDIIPSRDVLFEQIKSGAWRELIVCRKKRQYAVAAFFDHCRIQGVLLIKFNELSKVLVDENRKVLNKRIEQLCEKGRNGRYDEADLAYRKVAELFVGLNDNPT